MNQAVYKRALMEALPAAPEVPLEAPPPPGHDGMLPGGAQCPGCGGCEADLQPVEGGLDVAVCRGCQCEFSPRVESVSSSAIRRIRERREKRALRFMEELPAVLPGADPDDYALFKSIIDGASRNPKRDEAESGALAQAKERFIDDRTNGFTYNRAYYAPISREEAERRWKVAEPRFRAQLKSGDPDIEQRLFPNAQAYNHGRNRAEADVPNN